MRLISMDKLIEYCEKHRRASVPIDFIKAENPIISTGDTSVKYGKWIKERRKCKGMFELYQTYIHCSECGKEHYYGTGDMPNFCDNCGADMRGDTE